VLYAHAQQPDRYSDVYGAAPHDDVILEEVFPQEDPVGKTVMVMVSVYLCRCNANGKSCHEDENVPGIITHTDEPRSKGKLLVTHVTSHSFAECLNEDAIFDIQLRSPVKQELGHLRLCVEDHQDELCQDGSMQQQNRPYPMLECGADAAYTLFTQFTLIREDGYALRCLESHREHGLNKPVGPYATQTGSSAYGHTPWDTSNESQACFTELYHECIRDCGSDSSCSIEHSVRLQHHPTGCQLELSAMSFSFWLGNQSHSSLAPRYLQKRNVLRQINPQPDPLFNDLQRCLYAPQDSISGWKPMAKMMEPTRLGYRQNLQQEEQMLLEMAPQHLRDYSVTGLHVTDRLHAFP